MEPEYAGWLLTAGQIGGNGVAMRDEVGDGKTFEMVALFVS